MYVLFCPCIRDPGLRAAGITRDRDRELFSRALERCRRFGIPVRFLPCPETRYLGPDRQPATFSERLDTPAFTAVMDLCENEVGQLMEEEGSPALLVGVDASPVCGVTRTWRTLAGREPGRGAFLARFPRIPAYDVGAVAAYRIYLAAPLFSAAETAWNRQIAAFLEGYAYEVFLPQEAGDTEAGRGTDVHQRIFSANRAALDRADLVVAVIDGADADSGTAWEMGYAYARGIPVYAIRTDFRMIGLHERVNLMLEQAAVVVEGLQDLLNWLPCPVPVSPAGDEEKDGRHP